MTFGPFFERIATVVLIAGLGAFALGVPHLAIVLLICAVLLSPT